jgi:hypothetical protein
MFSYMKRILLAVLILATATFRAAADEGMWLPMLLGQQVYNDMVKKGLKLSKDQLYNINKASLKDAIVIFGGCTGEIVSNQGLIFTNHHCGYGVIAGASARWSTTTSATASMQRTPAKRSPALRRIFP